MAKFIGVKMVEAVPMTAKDAIKNHYIVSAFSSEKDGYEVTYNDGYKSWCPKSIFEATVSSFCVKPENYDINIDKKYTIEKAKDQIWAGLGFVLQWAINGLKKNSYS